MTRQLYSQPVLRSPLISQACDYDMDGAYHSRHLSSASSVDSGWLAYLRFAASAAQTVCLKAAPRLLLNHYLGHLGEARKRKHGTPPIPSHRLGFAASDCYHDHVTWRTCMKGRCPS